MLVTPLLMKRVETSIISTLTVEVSSFISLIYIIIIATKGVLDKLEPANMDGSSRTGCLENTRTDVLNSVIEWASDSTSTQRVLFLHGPAGSGKSTISTTLADHFRRSKQLGAFLYFDRDVTGRSDPALVARTLAYQLSSFHTDIEDLMISVIDNSPQTLISSIPSQFQELLIDPLSCMEPLHTKSQTIIILDALDECGSGKRLMTLANTLAQKSVNLPSTFRLIITSRSDKDIRFAFESQVHIRMMELDLASTTGNEDILTYFRHHLNTVQRKKSYLGKGWPGANKISTLAHRASGLFVWASIACSFIDAYDPGKRLDDIIQQGDTPSTAEVALDSLYQTALDSAGTWDDEDFVTDFRAVIGMILFLRDPLTDTAIDNLLANPDGRPATQIIEQLNCIISLNPTIRFIHPSLADFLMSRSRCGRDIWFFTPASHQRTLAILCLRRLQKVLHSDMSQSSLFVDKDDNDIPKDVVYACMFWVDHICMIEVDLAPIETLLTIFVDKYVLHWFEAMSLLKRFSLAITLLEQLSKWAQCHFGPGQNRLLALVRHWWKFSREYEECIQDCPMQVYSQELSQHFQIIEDQEPASPRPPTPDRGPPSNPPESWLPPFPDISAVPLHPLPSYDPSNFTALLSISHSTPAPLQMLALFPSQGQSQPYVSQPYASQLALGAQQLPPPPVLHVPRQEPYSYLTGHDSIRPDHVTLSQRRSATSNVQFQPHDFVITPDNMSVFACGHYGDVWKGSLRDGVKIHKVRISHLIWTQS
jgi:hypothetical protein